MMWDSGGWTLNRENPDIKFINPRSGAVGWMDTFALPARGRNEAGVYAWINFVMRPENRRQGGQVDRQLHRRQGRRRAHGSAPAAAVQRRPSPDGLKNIKWYPAIPPGLEEIEGGVLDRVKAAN